MIELKRKEDCCGCHACQTVCPKKCIEMRADEEGFLYPFTRADECIDCHLCEKVCPIINKNSLPAKERFSEPRVFALRSRDENLVQNSSSGGLFTMLAGETIARGGVVFGARWNADFSAVVHDWTETLEGLAAFRGSKYLQSVIGDNFAKAKRFLLAGRQVLFTGTPCQITGLRRALNRDFPNLLAVDIACWKVPSPLVWREFFNDLKRSFPQEKISDVRHRKKVENKGKFSCADLSVELAAGTLFQKPLYSTTFGKGFGSGLITRPSCSECPTKNRNSGSDLTIGDFWGVEKTFPRLNSQKGISVAIANNARGLAALEKVFPQCSVVEETKLENAVPFNGGLRADSLKNPKRAAFFEVFNAAKTTRERVKILEKFTKTPFPSRVKNFLFRVLRFSLKTTGTLKLAKKLLGK